MLRRNIRVERRNAALDGRAIETTQLIDKSSALSVFSIFFSRLRLSGTRLASPSTTSKAHQRSLEVAPLNQSPSVLTRKFVRVIERRANGLVVFEFSIGWPELASELVLPQAAFAAFCDEQRVTHLPDGPRGSSEILPSNPDHGRGE